MDLFHTRSTWSFFHLLLEQPKSLSKDEANLNSTDITPWSQPVWEGDALCNCTLSGTAGQRHVPHPGEWHAEPDRPHGPHGAARAAHREHPSLGRGPWQRPVSVGSACLPCCYFSLLMHTAHCSVPGPEGRWVNSSFVAGVTFLTRCFL